MIHEKDNKKLFIKDQNTIDDSQFMIKC